MSRKRTHSTSKRTRARRQALQMLFGLDFVDDVELPGDAAEVMDGVVVEEYAEELVDGVVSNQKTIDSAIDNASDNWSITRMAPTDRVILRIAVYEMLYRPDVPPSVSINEAVELAQSFGGEDESYKFVNGVLGRIDSQLPGLEPESADAASAEDAAEAPAEGTGEGERPADGPVAGEGPSAGCADGGQPADEQACGPEPSMGMRLEDAGKADAAVLEKSEDVDIATGVM